jgi:hypothetical protein
VLRVAFGHVKTLGIRNKLISKLYQHFRVRVTPTAYRMLCLRFACFVRPSLDSATDARLDTGGWLALTRPGLSPSKIRRASPGAITSKLTGRDDRSAPVQRLVGYAIAAFGLEPY